ncbi:hypothetical protein LCGC14_1108250 [marine sediment metagenome]|uniref:Uncharacterized protein n=1 Tax=marine sediment metagenome TaxID=412755 RepID=A0A0F9MVF8_9ZZZZ
MYKDKDKQREANRLAAKEYRDNRRKSIEGMTNEGMTTAPKNVIPVIPCSIKRGKDIKCFADLPPDVQQTIDKMSVVSGAIDQTIKANRTAIAVNYQHLFSDRYYPQSAVISSLVVTGKPGDADYNGICTEAWRAERGR